MASTSSPRRGDDRGREIRFYDFAARRARLIQALGDVDTYYGLTVSPDGKSFLYTLQHQSRNLMLVENFR